MFVGSSVYISSLSFVCYCLCAAFEINKLSCVSLDRRRNFVEISKELVSSSG